MIINDKVYGEQRIDNLLIAELLDSEELQRLKGVNQYGTWPLIDKKYDTTRFEHSFGVYCLLRRFNASFKEQVAGLIHDVNHGAFSHVMDYVLGDPTVQDFGDANQRDIVRNSSLPAILNRAKIDFREVCDTVKFGLLERELPDLCCDRVDYCLRDSICVGFLNHQQAQEILDGLFVYNQEIICRDEKSATHLGRLFLKTSKALWSNHIQSGSFYILAEAIRMAIESRIIEEEDLYTSDGELTDRLINSGDRRIEERLRAIRENRIVEGTEGDHDYFSRSKVRYIDPKFPVKEEVRRLSEVDNNFKKALEDHKRWVEKGFYVKIKK